MKKTSFPKATEIPLQGTFLSRTIGLDHPEGTYFRQGRDWRNHHVLRQDSFHLNVLDGYQSTESMDYTRQEDYIKINFYLGGKHTTILDGIVQVDHDCPEVFITAGPWEMVKADVYVRNAQYSSVALCFQQDFFSRCMNLDPDQLPEPLRGHLTHHAGSYVFHRLPLSSDLVGAARSVLYAPAAVRREPLYVQAKAVELMCLLINRMESYTRVTRCIGEPRGRVEARVHDARNFLTQNFAEAVTLERICREVGLNKMALCSGFRQVFGMSVHDCLQKIRMERAYELLQDEANTIYQVAEAVGYQHARNFSTAYRAYFGCAPRTTRANGS